MMEQLLLGPLRVRLGTDRGRVVADQNHLDALQPHHAMGLRPAPVIADGHAEDSAKSAQDVEAEITGLEIPLLQMLDGAFRFKLRMTRQMNLAVLGDDPGGSVGENAGVEMAPVRRTLGLLQACRK